MYYLSQFFIPTFPLSSVFHLDPWVYEYNYERTHTGKQCYGKTPMQTFLDSIHLAKEKMLDQQYVKMNNEGHLSAVGNPNASDEMITLLKG